MGRGAEAVKHFETLIDQQNASGTRQPHHAMPYVFLGNMYGQQGEQQKALELWEAGYALFPNTDELAKRARGGK